MLTQEEFTVEMLRNPLAVQARALTELQNRLMGGEPLLDGNNVATFLMEMASTLTADSINAMADALPGLYPVRAQTSEDLFRHMSTWDYLNLFSRPSDCKVSLYLDADYLRDNAKDVNINYQKVVLPKNTIFTIAGYKFGIHYPIEIRINKSTKTFLPLYNLAEKNPLRDMKQNTIDFKVSEYAGLNLLVLDFPVFQFEKYEVEEELVSSIGFTKTYTHPDKFYAARIYTNPNGEWIEIDQTLSDEVYNPRNITAKLYVLSDTKQLKVTIPQIYFDREAMGEKLKLEIYTTKGAVDIDISGVTQENIDVTIPSGSNSVVDEYSEILDHIPTIGLTTKSAKITGGSNGYGFDELVQRVINNTFYGNVLITNDELEKYFTDVGFSVNKYRDGITDRIYHCYKELLNAKSEIIASGDLPTFFTMDKLQTCSRTVKQGLDNSITILPTTLYKYNADSGLAEMVDDSVVDNINGYSKEEIVELFNNNIYTYSPFHTRLDLNDEHPVAYTYDLMNPNIDKVEFVRENVNIVSQMVIVAGSITHESNGAGGFKLRFTVRPSDDLKEADPTTFKMLVKTHSDAGGLIYTDATYLSTMDDGYVYELNIDTDYTITRDHEIHTTTFRNPDGFSAFFLPLSFEMDVVFMIPSTLVTDPAAGLTEVGGVIPDGYDNLVPVSEQLVSVVLGEMVEIISNDVDVRYSAIVYDTYAIDSMKTHYTDTYYTDANGVPTYHMEGGNPALDVKIRKDDWVLEGEFDGTDTFKLTCDTTAGSNQVVVTNPSGKVLEHHMGFDCKSFPVQTTITDVAGDGVTLTLSNPADVDSTGVDAFIDHIVYDHYAGDPKLGPTGEPTVVKDREVQYAIDMPHIDAKITRSEDPADANYVSVVTGFVRTYFEILRAAKEQLIENTRIYFKPMRTMGLGRFRTSKNNIRYEQLEFSFRFKVYAEKHVINNLKMQKIIRDTILSILDKHVAKPLISYADIVKDIRDAMPDSVTSVDIVGINDDMKLQTIIVDDIGTKVSVKRKLILDENNLIYTKRALDLDFIEV